MLDNDLLDIQILEFGMIALELVSRDIRDFLQKSITENHGFGEQYSIEFMLLESPESFEVVIDPARMVSL